MQLNTRYGGKPWKLNEEVFVEQPQGFEIRDAADKVYKLRKALYG